MGTLLPWEFAKGVQHVQSCLSPGSGKDSDQPYKFHVLGHHCISKGTLGHQPSQAAPCSCALSLDPSKSLKQPLITSEQKRQLGAVRLDRGGKVQAPRSTNDGILDRDQLRAKPAAPLLCCPPTRAVSLTPVWSDACFSGSPFATLRC